MRTFASRRKNSLTFFCAFFVSCLSLHAQTVCSGTVRDAESAAPLPYAYVAIADNTFSVAAQGATDESGKFSITSEKAITNGYVIVQPPAQENKDGIGIYRHTPRIYVYKGESQLDITLPPAACIVLMAYDLHGNLLRWEDFRKRGTFGDQFVYLTDLNDCAVEAACWPVYDAEARALGQPREKGLPALILSPGAGYVPQVLFWETKGFGKLLLRADNKGKGFTLDKPGAAHVLNLNYELAKTAAHDLERRQFTEGTQPVQMALQAASGNLTPRERAAASDTALALALRLRDELELKRARETIAANAGAPRDFSFGVFEGSPYNSNAFQIARTAGFDMATVLLGWGWTDANGKQIDRNAIETTFGIEKLRIQGFALKAHGSVWLQDYGILPARAKSIPAADLPAAMVAQQQALLNTFSENFSVWEAMNEPNATNVVGMPRPAVESLLQNSAALVKNSPSLISLVNGAHEGDFGRRFAIYSLDNTPASDWSRTYFAYLADLATKNALDAINVVGLQYYPGFHFNESFGGLQGPATTPSWFVDTLERYARLGKPLHITEFSLPSSYDQSWTSGYWRGPWTPALQADYAEYIFTLAYANPNVKSITWWDVLDTKSSVITGGLCDAQGNPKPVLERLSNLIASWKKP